MRICCKKERKKERVFPSSFTLLFLSFSPLLYTFVIYNAEKRKKCVQFLSLSLRSADKTYIVYLVLRYSVYFANYENSAFVRVCVCVCDKYGSIWVFDFSIVAVFLLGLCFFFLRILFCFVFKHSLLLTPSSLCLLWFA